MKKILFSLFISIYPSFIIPMHSKITPIKKIIHLQSARTISDEAHILLYTINSIVIGFNFYGFIKTSHKEAKIGHFTATTIAAASITLENPQILSAAMAITGASFALEAKFKKYVQDKKDDQQKIMLDKKEIITSLQSKQKIIDQEQQNKELEQILTLTYKNNCNFKELQKFYTNEK